jgi:hypothetical protein
LKSLRNDSRFDKLLTRAKAANLEPAPVSN